MTKALDILKERLAKGEISHDEFQSLKATLVADDPSTAPEPKVSPAATEAAADDVVIMGRTPAEWGEYIGSTLVIGVIGTFIIRATVFESAYRWFFEKVMVNEGVGWLDRQINHGLFDMAEIKSSFGTGYVIPFIVCLVIVSVIREIASFGSK